MTQPEERCGYTITVQTLTQAASDKLIYEEIGLCLNIANLTGFIVFTQYKLT